MQQLLEYLLERRRLDKLERTSRSMTTFPILECRIEGHSYFVAIAVDPGWITDGLPASESFTTLFPDRLVNVIASGLIEF